MAATINELFSKATHAYPANTAFHYYHDGWKTCTYETFLALVISLASNLLKLGLRRQQRVAIILENRIEWCAAYLATVKAGGIAVPVDEQLGPEEVSNLLLDADTEMIFHSAKTFPNLRAYMAAVGNVPGRPLSMINCDSPEFAVAAGSAPPESFPEPSPADIASIIYTSGTTGKPKGVMLSHENFCADAQALIGAGIVSHEDNVLSVLPLHHTYAFMCTFLVPVFLGGAITYPRSLKGPDLVSAIATCGVTVVIGVPQLLGMIRTNIMDNIRSQPKIISFLLMRALSLSGRVREATGINPGKVIFRSAHAVFGRNFRFFVSGGAKLDPATMKDLEALGFTVLEGYGLTETSPVITFNPYAKRKPGSAGKPLPSVQIRIMTPSAQGEGEIEVKGPMVMQGYYKNPRATREVLNEGWFRTGDIGRMDQDGYLFITGRSKEIIVLSSGKNIYPEELEKTFLQSALIKEICVTGVEHEGITDSLHAVIVPDFESAKQAGIANIQDAIKWEIQDLSAKLPSYMRVTGFSIRQEPLPRTPLGKLRRFMITAAQAGPARKKASAGEELPHDETGKKVMLTVRAFTKGEREIGLRDNLELDAGLDSLSKIELTVALEKVFSVKLPENFMADVHTVEELADAMRHFEAGPAGGRIEKTGWKEILSVDPEKAVALERPDAFMAPSRIMHGVLRIAARILFRLEAQGAEHIPAEQGCIITPNHTSYLDGFVVVLSLPFPYFRRMYSLGISDFFTGLIKSWFARIGHVIPIDSASYLNKALQTAAYVLRHGRSLCVFPEGGRSADGTLMEFKKGVGILAIELGVPVVPALIEGAYEALPRGSGRLTPGKIRITYGKPLRASDIDFSQKPGDLDEYQYFVNVLREKVRALKKAGDLSGT